jgi:hypothetical protein
MFHTVDAAEAAIEQVHAFRVYTRPHIYPRGVFIMAMPACENCGKRSIRRRHRVFLKDTKRTLYYCVACTAKALENDTIYTRHVVSAKRLGLTEEEARASIAKKHQ